MLSSFVAASVAAFCPPAEYVIDCSGWPGQVKTELSFRFVTRDGKAISDTMYLFPDTKGDAPMLAFHFVLRHYGWRYEKLDENRMVVRGSKTSAMKRIEFKSAGWVGADRHAPDHRVHDGRPTA